MAEPDDDEPEPADGIAGNRIPIVLRVASRETLDGHAGGDGIEQQEYDQETGEEVAIHVAKMAIALQPALPGDQAFDLGLDMLLQVLARSNDAVLLHDERKHQYHQ